MTIRFITLGCRLNQAEEAIFAAEFSAAGWTVVQGEVQSDVVIVRSCAVTRQAERSTLQTLRALKLDVSEDLLPFVVVTGCATAAIPALTLRDAGADLVVVKGDEADLLKIVGKAFGEGRRGAPVRVRPIAAFPSALVEPDATPILPATGTLWASPERTPLCRHKEMALLKVQDGCAFRCSYCIVPYVRGRERSRKKEDILEEIKILKEKGYLEVTLLGQNVNAYGKDIDDLSFPRLLEEIALIGIERIRFTTSHPWDFSEELIDVIAKYDNIMNHIQLPVQAGDDEILRLMGRRYSRQQYLDLVERIRAKIPNVSLTTDIIVGFPNESEEAFNNTLSLCEIVKYDSAFTFIYSPRVGTPAAKMKDNVSMETKKQRFNKLTATIAKYELEKYKTYENKIVKVLVEGPSKKNEEILSGYTEDNKLVNFKGNKDSIGQIVNVKITTAKTFTLEGEQVD